MTKLNAKTGRYPGQMFPVIVANVCCRMMSVKIGVALIEIQKRYKK